MKSEKHIQRWLDEGLIDSQTATRLFERESQRKGMSFGNVLIGLAGICIILGIAAIIGSNWDKIPAAVKISVHTIVNGLVAITLFHLSKTGKSKTIWFELFVGLLAGLTLTFIALVGQIFQTQEPTWKALALWMALATPFWLWLAESRKLIVLWILSFLYAYHSFAGSFFELFDSDVTLTFVLLMALLPYGMIAIGQNIPFRKIRSLASLLISKTGYILFIIGFSIAQMGWHPSISFSYIAPIAALCCFCAAIGIVTLRKFGALVPVAPALDLLLVIGTLLAPLPFLIPHQEGYPVIEAVINMAYWALCGWVGLNSGRPKMLTIAAIFIVLRLIGIYIEVFGSLLSTGVGLIISGVLLIALVQATRKSLAYIHASHKEKLT